MVGRISQKNTTSMLMIFHPFQNPNDWVFPWLTQDTIQIAEFYEVVEKKETAYIYQDPVTGER